MVCWCCCYHLDVDNDDDEMVIEIVDEDVVVVMMMKVETILLFCDSLVMMETWTWSPCLEREMVVMFGLEL